jgi:hypothetical protein
MSRLCLYFLPEPERDRWVPGDRLVRPLVRRIVRGKPRAGGVDKVFINLRLGLDRLGLRYTVNLPFRQLRPTDRVAVLGRGRHCLDGYAQPNPIVAGIGLMTHPSEWPTLCTDYPVVRYLQHSAWADAVYRPYFGNRCAIWPVGIDTDEWHPDGSIPKKFDFLIYDKIRWNRAVVVPAVLEPIRADLSRQGLTWNEIGYGAYEPGEFRQALLQSRAVIFLTEHESQGLAAQECLASGIPMLAWDPGFVADPERFKWGQAVIPSTTVPYFDARCGLTFRDESEFATQLPAFLARLRAGQLAPRDYILENLTLEKCARHFVEIVEAAQTIRP